jgi:hypothetical protein
MLADKLDYIMKLTNTKNSDLAKALNFDPSYVSRMRSGKRGLPNHHPFVEPAARFFARRVTEDYQKKSLSAAILDGKEWPEDLDVARIVIGAWFNDDSPSYNDTITRFLERMSKTDTLDPAAAYGEPTAADLMAGFIPGAGEPAEVDFFYGLEGKRDAVFRLLEELVNAGGPSTLLMHTDENMDWLSESKYYSSRWSSLLAHFLNQGGKIIIIHTIYRNLSDMLSAIERWMPLYLTGKVEPWYCPHLRDGILRRTFFICPEKNLALVSNSIGQHTERVPSILVRHPAAVSAYEQEFRDFLDLCRPLASITPLKSLSEVPSDLRTYAFRFQLADNLPKDIRLYVDEKKGVAVVHTAAPFLIMHTDEPHLIRVFMDYWLLYHR